MDSFIVQKEITSKKNSFLRKLPLLDFTSNSYPIINIKETYIICAQHLASTSYSLFQTLLDRGLEPSNLSVIGKCYSTDPQTYKEIKKLGIDVCPSSLEFDSHRSYDSQYRENIKIFVKNHLKKITNSNWERIIVLDDGGELISAFNSLVQNFDNVLAIEQTSSGYRKLKRKKIRFPIINIARSPAKLIYESPIIAKLVITTLLDYLEKGSFHLENILVIGNGPIGSQIREALESYYRVSIFDKKISKSSILAEDFEKSLSKFDMIIGCTGKNVLGPKHYELLKKNVILVSTSSSDREFDSVHLRKKLPKVSDCHESLLVNRIHLINCGFPVNFSAEYRKIDCDNLQLTRSLLYAGIFQACSSCGNKKIGFIPLDSKIQKNIIQKYEELIIYEKFENREKLAI